MHEFTLYVRKKTIGLKRPHLLSVVFTNATSSSNTMRAWSFRVVDLFLVFGIRYYCYQIRIGRLILEVCSSRTHVVFHQIYMPYFIRDICCIPSGTQAVFHQGHMSYFIRVTCRISPVTHVVFHQGHVSYSIR